MHPDGIYSGLDRTTFTTLTAHMGKPPEFVLKLVATPDGDQVRGSFEDKVPAGIDKVNGRVVVEARSPSATRAESYMV